jgi:hypothetical protein
MKLRQTELVDIFVAEYSRATEYNTQIVINP